MIRNILLGWFGTFLQLFLRLSWGVISIPIAVLLHLNTVEIGLVATSFYIGYVISSIPWGLVIDKIGPNKAITISALILVPFNLLLFFSLNSYVLLVVVYLIDGLVAAAIFPSAMKIVAISHSDGSKFTFYIALVESAAPITTLLLSLIATILLHLWKFVYLLMAIGFLLLGILSAKINPNVTSTEIRKSLKIIFDKRIALSTLIRLGELWATWGTTTWIFPMLILYKDISPSLSALFLLLFGIGQLVGIISVDRLVQLVGTIKVILLNLIGFIIISLLLTISNDNLILSEAFLLGIFSFSYRPPTDSLIMKISGGGSAGTSIGYANAISQIGTMIAPTVVGLVLYLTKSFTFSMIALDIGCIISVISLIILETWL
ncbi:MFS transporter [Sulfolobus sp. S-194]|uniref:MFS transporter n=1 Tax=Sulfolobus sp. S-194 TaxID=2512240 RepID=UPI001436F2E7|nr:MFS transporter [Sulfolobus sp. S-194]QIW23891.1 MFS transporter [Sulfolobus sp. S-194]